MLTEVGVLTLVGERLSRQGIPYMLTGSFALGYYATPRMTRDLDIVVRLSALDVGALVSAFAADFYIDAEVARLAVAAERMFNLMHLDSGIKVDFIIRKSTVYRQLEFGRRKLVNFGAASTWIVSVEDLILSKLAWALDSDSEMQHRDVRQLLTGVVDVDYLRRWAPSLGVEAKLRELMT